MRFGIHTIDDFDVKGKTVLCRVDMNQPVDRETGRLKSTHRIEACAETVRELAEKKAKVVLLCHQGSDIEYKNFYTTKPHAEALSGFLGFQVRWIDDVCGPAARNEIKKLNEGEVLLLDNVRFMSEEQTLFETHLKLTQEEQAKTEVVKKLAPLADLYVCDAFAAAHRDQPSLCGFEQVLPSAMGRLFEKEYCVISELMENPGHPSVFVLGGSKVADAFLMMETVLANGSADLVLSGGMVGNILLLAKHEKIGRRSREYIEKSGYSDLIGAAEGLLEKYGSCIAIPKDVACVTDGERIEYEAGRIPEDSLAVDIGEKTAAEYCRNIAEAKTVFFNGPMGIFEEVPSEKGTKKILEALAETGAFTVVGGGDSVTAVKKYGADDRIGYICTGGGALIRFLTGEVLPVVKALRAAGKRYEA